MRGGSSVEIKQTGDAADNWRKSWPDSPLKTLTQLGFDITDTMRTKPADGVPLFSRDNKALERKPTIKELHDANNKTKPLNQRLTANGMEAVVALRNAPTREMGIGRRIAEVLGFSVTFIEPHNSFDGVSYGGEAFVSNQTEFPAVALVGHELLHSLKNQDAAAYQSLLGSIRTYIKDGVIDAKRRWEDANGGVNTTVAVATEEIMADLNGAMWLDSKFWAELADNDPSTFRKVAYKFMELATKALRGIGRFDAGTMVSNVDAVRTIIAKEWARQAQKRGAAGLELTNAPIKNIGGDTQNSLTPFDGSEVAKTPLGNTKTIIVDGKEYSVFNSDGNPIQIKSAAGNNGAFDSANPDIRFSRAAYKDLGKDGVKAITKESLFNKKTVSKLIASQELSEANRDAAKKFIKEIKEKRQTRKDRGPYGVLKLDKLLFFGGGKDRLKGLIDVKRSKEQQQKIIDKDLEKRNALQKQGESLGWSQEDIDAVKYYDDRASINAEGAAATVRAVSVAAMQQGWALESVSNRGGGESHYLTKKGKMVRISDHDLPFTPEREYNRSRGLLGRWDAEILTEHWQYSNIGEYLQELESKVADDNSSPDIRFSRASDFTKAATDALNDSFSVPGKLNWWHKTVGSMYNLAERSPEFKRVFESGQNFINDVSLYATEAADLAPKILPKVETIKDMAKSPISYADNKAIAAPIFEGTLSWKRDKSGKPVRTKEGEKAGIVWTDAELKSQFNLIPAQINLYKEFRASTDRSLDNAAKAAMLRQAGKDADGLQPEGYNCPRFSAH